MLEAAAGAATCPGGVLSPVAAAATTATAATAALPGPCSLWACPSWRSWWPRSRAIWGFWGPRTSRRKTPSLSAPTWMRSIASWWTSTPSTTLWPETGWGIGLGWELVVSGWADKARQFCQSPMNELPHWVPVSQNHAGPSWPVFLPLPPLFLWSSHWQVLKLSHSHLLFDPLLSTDVVWTELTCSQQPKSGSYLGSEWKRKPACYWAWPRKSQNETGSNWKPRQLIAEVPRRVECRTSQAARTAGTFPALF